MSNAIDLNGRKVVTGGAQGIGRAIVARLLSSGAEVAIWDQRIRSMLSAPLGELRNLGREVDGVAST